MSNTSANSTMRWTPVPKLNQAFTSIVNTHSWIHKHFEYSQVKPAILYKNVNQKSADQMQQQTNRWHSLTNRIARYRSPTFNPRFTSQLVDGCIPV